MPTVTINGQTVDVPKGTPIIRAAAMLGFNIPHFCYHPALSSPANCRMCLVEIENARKLEPSCYMKCSDGMVVQTETPKIIAARQAVLEFILVNHPVDCPICDQAGECKLQDYYMAYDHRPSRVGTVKTGKPKVYPIGPHVVYDGERCILCTRCVRFCDEVTGTSELTVVERGDRSWIRAFPGQELDNPYSMNVTDICPVGALTTRDFRFKCRVWLMSSTDSICTGCSRGCNVHMEHYQGTVQRYRPRFNPDVNEYWMCDQGRLSYKRLHADRLTTVRIAGNSELRLPRALRQLTGMVQKTRTTGGRFALAISIASSCETMHAARHLATEVLGATEADIFWTGRPDGASDDFLVQSDKNPNRAGFAAIFGDEALDRDEAALLAALTDKTYSALWIIGGETSGSVELVSAIGRLDLSILQSAFVGALAAAATATLPSASHAEQDGTFINGDGVIQPFYKAFESAEPALSDLALISRVSEMAGAPLKSDSVEKIQDELFALASE
jgi:NADH-quinone oxidoreductase subunit G